MQSIRATFFQFRKFEDSAWMWMCQHIMLSLDAILYLESRNQVLITLKLHKTNTTNVANILKLQKLI